MPSDDTYCWRSTFLLFKTIEHDFQMGLIYRSLCIQQNACFGRK
uniref:Uncharacterized protein n=1 Tax=Rhizophora mucronata TaxID=61149 RepID=A0A2P2P0K4_RHIMU